MTLTALQIAKEHANIEKLQNEAETVNEMLFQLITELLKNDNFNNFCSETKIGNNILKQLEELQEIITNQVIINIKSLSNIINNF